MLIGLVAASALAETPKDIVAKIRAADYEGDRSALHSLASQLEPFSADSSIASRIRYWRGFAFWRSAINGFNLTPPPADIETDLKSAVAEFQAARTLDPSFADAIVAEASATGSMYYFLRSDAERVKAFLPKLLKLYADAKAAAPNNPRFYWVDGPRLWIIGTSRGGGQDAAIASYERGIEMWRNEQTVKHGDLDPTWGEPELYMSLAWSFQNKKQPDLAAAHHYAQLALKHVPNWHYVRDILAPSIEKARKAG